MRRRRGWPRLSATALPLPPALLAVALLTAALLSACIAEEEPPATGPGDSAAQAGDEPGETDPAAGAETTPTPRPGTRSDAEVLTTLSSLLCWSDDPADAATCLPPDNHTLDVIEEMGRSRDPRFLAPLIDLLQVDVGWDRQVRAALLSLTGQRLGDAAGWFEWYATQPPTHLVPGYAAWKATLLGLLPPRGDVGYADLLTATVARPDLLWWTGTAPGGRPSLTNPEVIHRLEERYLAPDDVVYGVLVGGEARAYPRRIVAWHGVVNDTVSGTAITVSHCLPCAGARAFVPIEDGRRLTFADSGLATDGRPLIYDAERARLWDALTGTARSTLAGGDAPAGLATLPLATTTWGEWSARFPNTSVLALDTGFVRDYESDAALANREPPPGAPVDARLPPLEPVVGVLAADGAHAWTIAQVEAARVLHATVGGESFVLISTGAGSGVQVYRAPGLLVTTLEGSGSDLRVVDEHGERWFVQPRALVSTLDGREHRAATWVEVGWAGWVGLTRQAGLPTTLEAAP